MKTIEILFATAFIAILSISTTYAAKMSDDDVVIGNSSTAVTLNLSNMGKLGFTVKIMNEAQEILMSETVKNTPDFLKKYNVAALPNGPYNMIVLGKNQRVTQPFSLQDGVLSLSESDKKIVYFPVVTFKNDRLDVNLFLGYYGKITVNVLDEEGNKIFRDKNLNVEKLHKRYFFKDLERGNYTVEVLAGGEAFYYSMSK